VSSTELAHQQGPPAQPKQHGLGLPSQTQVDTGTQRGPGLGRCPPLLLLRSCANGATAELLTRRGSPTPQEDDTRKMGSSTHHLPGAPLPPGTPLSPGPSSPRPCESHAHSEHGSGALAPSCPQLKTVEDGARRRKTVEDGGRRRKTEEDGGGRRGERLHLNPCATAGLLTSCPPRRRCRLSSPGGRHSTSAAG